VQPRQPAQTGALGPDLAGPRRAQPGPL